MWLYLTLLSAFSLATADALSKRYLAGYRARELVLVRFGLSGILLLPWVLIQPWPSLPLAFWGWMSILLPLEILAMLLYMLAIRDSPLSLTLPYLAFTPVITVLTGYLFLGESVSLQGFGGIVLVVTGAWWLNIDRARNHRKPWAWLAPFRAIIAERGSRLMLLAAMVYSLTSVISKAALLFTTPAFFGPFYFVAIGACTFLLFGLREPDVVRSLWRKPAANLAVAAAMAVMAVAHFFAIAGIEVAYMISVKRTSLLFGILYGIVLFREPHGPSRLFAGILMVAGVLLIAG